MDGFQQQDLLNQQAALIANVRQGMDQLITDAGLSSIDGARESLLLTMQQAIRSLVILHYDMANEPLMFVMDQRVETVLQEVMTKAFSTPAFVTLAQTTSDAKANHTLFYSLLGLYASLPRPPARNELESAFSLISTFLLNETKLTDGTYISNPKKREAWEQLTLLRYVLPAHDRRIVIEPSADDKTILQPDIRRHITSFMLQDMNSWPTNKLSSMGRVNQRKTWAQAFGVWDFSLLHPMMRVNNMGALQRIVQGTQPDVTIEQAVDGLQQCLTNEAKFKTDRSIHEMDALMAILAQARQWEKDEEQVLYISAEATDLFLTWIIRKKERDNYPSPNHAYSHLLRFFSGQREYRETLLVLPIVTEQPDHYTLAAFWWVDIKDRQMNYAFFDSVWDGTVKTSNAFNYFEQCRQRIFNVWEIDQATNTTYVSFGPSVLHQVGAHCGATVLYGMDRLCRRDTKTPDARDRVTQYAATFSNIGTHQALFAASSQWAADLQDTEQVTEGSWALQIMLLKGLGTMYGKTLPLTILDQAGEFMPFLASWERAVIYTASQVLAQTNGALAYESCNALQLQAFIIPWNMSLTNPFNSNYEDAKVLNTYQSGGTLSETAIAQEIPTIPWSPDVELIAALVICWVATAPVTKEEADAIDAWYLDLGEYLQEWFLHVLFFPEWPLGGQPPAEALIARRARDFWRALSTYADRIQRICTPMEDDMKGMSPGKKEQRRIRAWQLIQRVSKIPGDFSTDTRPRDRIQRVFAAAYMRFLTPQAGDDQEEFASENVLGAFWPEEMCTVTTSPGLHARYAHWVGYKYWNPEWASFIGGMGMAAYDGLLLGIIRGMVASVLVTWNPNNKSGTSPIKSFRLTDREEPPYTTKASNPSTKAFFPDTTWERAGIILCTRAADSNEKEALQLRLAELFIKVELPNVKGDERLKRRFFKELLTHWNEMLDAIVTISKDTKKTYKSRVLDPRMQVFFFTDNDLRPAPDHFLYQWTQKAVKLFADPRVDEPLSLSQAMQLFSDVSDAVQYLKDREAALQRAIEDQDTALTTTGNSAVLAQLQQDDADITLDASALKQRATLLVQHVKQEILPELPGDRWDKVPLVSKFKTDWAARQEMLSKAGERPVHASGSTVAERIKRILADRTGLGETKIPEELVVFFQSENINVDKDLPLLGFCLSVMDSYQAFQDSAVGTVTKRQNLPPRAQNVLKNHFLLMEKAELLFEGKRRLLKKKITTTKERVIKLTNDDRYLKVTEKIIRGLADFQNADMETRKTLSPWYATADDINIADDFQSVPLTVHNLPVPGSGPSSIRVWTALVKRKETKILPVLAAPTADEELMVYGWFNDELEKLRKKHETEFQQKLEDIVTSAAQAYSILYSNREVVTTLSDVITALFPLTSTIANDPAYKAILTGLSDNTWPSTFLTTATQRTALDTTTFLAKMNQLVVAYDRYDFRFMRTSDQHSGWQHFYMTPEFNMPNTLLGAILQGGTGVQFEDVNLADPMKARIARTTSLYLSGLFNPLYLARLYVILVDAWLQHCLESSRVIQPAEWTAIKFPGHDTLLQLALTQFPEFKARLLALARQGATVDATSSSTAGGGGGGGASEWLAEMGTFKTTLKDATFLVQSIPVVQVASLQLKYNSLTTGPGDTLDVFREQFDNVNTSIKTIVRHYNDRFRESAIRLWLEQLLVNGSMFAKTHAELQDAMGPLAQQRFHSEKLIKDAVEAFTLIVFPKGVAATLAAYPTTVDNAGRVEAFTLGAYTNPGFTYPSLSLMEDDKVEELWDTDTEIRRDIRADLTRYLQDPVDASVNAVDWPVKRAEWVHRLQVARELWTERRTGIQKRVTYVPFLKAPVSVARNPQSVLLELDYLTQPVNLTRALLALDLQRSPPPPITGAVIDKENVGALFEQDANAFGGDDLSYLSNVQRDTMADKLEDTLNRVAVAATASLDLSQRALQAIQDVAATKQLEIRVPLRRELRVRLETRFTLAELNTLAGGPLPPYPFSEKVQHAFRTETPANVLARVELAHAVATLLPDILVAWISDYETIQTRKTQGEETVARYRVQRDALEDMIQAIHPDLDWHELSDTWVTRAAALEQTLTAAVTALEQQNGPITLGSLKTYEDALPLLLTQLTDFEHDVATEYDQHTYLIDAQDADDARDEATQLFAAINTHFQAALAPVAQLQTSLGQLRGRNSAVDLQVAAAQAARGLLDTRYTQPQLYVARYEDQGDDTRPPWLASGLKLPGSELSRKKFAFTYFDTALRKSVTEERWPDEQDEIRALTTHSPEARRAAEELRTRRAEFELVARAQRKRDDEARMLEWQSSH